MQGIRAVYKTVNKCKKQGFAFNAINDNAREMIERWETIRGKSRQISILMTVQRSRGHDDRKGCLWRYLVLNLF